MNEKELKIFVDIICQYFTKATRSAPSLEDPILEFRNHQLLDYTGFLEINGSNRGWVYLSMTRLMLVEVIHSMGEEQTDDALLLDSIGEIASIITSNAREHFGPLLQISVPTSIGPSAPPPSHLNSQLRFILPFSWRTHHAKVGIALTAS